MHIHSRVVAVAVGCAFTVALVAGCAPGGQSGASSTAGAISKDLGSSPITLTVISTPESGALVEKAIPGFEKEYPNVTVDYTATAYDDYNTNLNLDLASDDAPDVVLLNSVGNAVKNGLVRPLDDYADLYGWGDVYPATQLAQWRVGEDGSTLGSGDLYAAPAGFSIVGLYYNKEIAKQIGLTELPTDLASFEAALETAKAAGVLPLQLGNSEGHAAFPVQLVGQSIDGASDYSSWVFGHAGSTFDSKGNTKALTLLSDWAQKGYIPSDANGVNLQGAVDAFIKGDGLFFVDGTWDAGKISDGAGDKVGFIPFPGQTTTGIGTSVAYAIAAKSDAQDAAAAFLNYLNTPEAGVFQFESGFIPVNAANANPSGLRADIIDAFAKVGKADGLVGFDANATATMNDTLTIATQELIGGRTSVADAITSIQNDWLQSHKG